MSDVIELAHELAAAVKSSPEFLALQEAKSRVEDHEAARVMLADYRKREASVRRDMQQGKDTASDIEALGKLTEVLMLNPYLRDYLMAEIGLAKLFAQIQKILGEAVELESTDSVNPSP